MKSMSNKYCIYDTFSNDVVFHDTEEQAYEDFQTVVEIIESLEAKGHEVYLYEIKKKMKYV